MDFIWFQFQNSKTPNFQCEKNQTFIAKGKYYQKGLTTSKAVEVAYFSFLEHFNGFLVSKGS